MLDLDTVAWEPGQVAVARDVREFCESKQSWVVEGCYASLVHAALAYSPVLVFLEPGVEACLDNCRNRQHKLTTRVDASELVAKAGLA